MRYRIHRMKEPAREAFRSAAHTSAPAVAKPKDYELSDETEAENAYAVWVALRETERALQTGDILEDETGALHIAKFIGFEPAQWWVPEPKPPVAIASGGATENQQPS
ncbi:MAG TPA: hypothetical protein VN633_09345 [Bryobacteraceae bacterium]|nr:hypothetical protein [Bryobacteraceae bacterium]